MLVDLVLVAWRLRISAVRCLAECFRTNMKFVRIFSCETTLFSLPLTTKYPPGSRGHSPMSPYRSEHPMERTMQGILHNKASE